MVRRLSRLFFSFALIAGLSTSLQANECDTTPDWLLDIPSDVSVGGTIPVSMVGPANTVAFFMVSAGPGPTDSAYGPLCVDFPLLSSFIFRFNSSGEASFEGVVPPDAAACGLTVFIQFLTCEPVRGVSNQVCVTFGGDLCETNCSYTPGGWGTSCSGDNPGCRRDAHFDTVFPSGLLLGDPDGADGDGYYSLLLTSSAAVEAFLPDGGTPSALDSDLTDPTSSSAGEFATQLSAAKLNVGFDDAGLLDRTGGTPLGDMVFVNCVDSGLLGMSVRQLIDLADAAISGMDTGYTASTLNDALDALNNNFVDCTANNGCLGLP